MKYVKALAIYFVSVILMLVVFPTAYSIALGGAIVWTFIFFPVTYLGLRKQLKLSFSGYEKLVCSLISLFVITLLNMFAKNGIEYATDSAFLVSFFTSVFGPIIVSAAVITQFNVRKLAKINK
ncbi:MAG: hypothetical protein WCD45_04930 [Gallionella sp.]